MKYLFSLLFFLAIATGASAQFKIVRLQVDNDTIYFKYFYASRYNSDHTINDNVKLVARKINLESFYLTKKVRGITKWTRICHIQPRTDSLTVTTNHNTPSGKSRITRSKVLYYHSILREI